MALTAEKYYQPPIALVDPESGEKVKLHLRTMTFQREVSLLPKDLLELHNLFVTRRTGRNEDVYMLVMTWNKLRAYARFWTSFKFQSEAEYLAYYDLPDGTTLGSLTVMVELFDKPTFTLLGETVLNFMIRLVGEYQDDTDVRKKDYQSIFDRYCKFNENFDKTTFYGAVRHYVTEKYEKPKAEEAGVTREQWVRQKKAFLFGTSRQRVTHPAPEKQTFGPRVERDFEWQKRECSACVSKITIIKDALRHIKKLEEVIQKQLGKDGVPKRPLILQNL